MIALFQSVGIYYALLYAFISLVVAILGAFIVHFYSSDLSFSYKHSMLDLPSPLSFANRNKISTIVIFIFSFMFCLMLDFHSFSSFLIYGIAMLMLILGLIDAFILAIPDILNFLLLIACILLAFINPNVIFLEHLLLGFGVGGFFAVLKMFYQSISGKEIMGDADIIVISAIGIGFDVPKIIGAIFFGSVIALCYALISSFIKKQKLSQVKLPFVLYMFFGFFIACSL